MQYIVHPDQPSETDIRLVDGVFVKAVTFRHAGMFAPQHAHSYDHLSYLASGSARVTADGVVLGDYVAPAAIVIKARVKHMFEILAPNTVVLCIHNADHSEAGDPVIHAEHIIQYEE